MTFAFLLFLSGHASISDRTITLYPFDRTKTDFMLLLMAFVVLPLHPHHAPVTSKLLHLVVTSDYWGPREPAGGLRIPVFLRHPDLLQPDPQIQGGDTLEEQLST